MRLGALAPTRDFTFVEDTVDGFLRAAGCDRALGQVVNVGSGKEISIGELARLLIEVSGRTAEIATEAGRLRPEASEVERLCCDASRAADWMGWTPRVPLREGLERTCRWVAAHPEAFKADVYNV